MRRRVTAALRWFAATVRHPLTLRAAVGSYVQGPARVRGRLSLARGTVVLRGLDCVGPVSIGASSFVNAHAYLRPGVTIGSNVAIGSHVRLITDTHELGDHRRRAMAARNEPILIEDGAWVGAGVIVLPGVTVGMGAIVAAGSVVTSDVTPHTLVAGIPARTRRTLSSGGVDGE